MKCPRCELITANNTVSCPRCNCSFSSVELAIVDFKEEQNEDENRAEAQEKKDFSVIVKALEKKLNQATDDNDRDNHSDSDNQNSLENIITPKIYPEKK